MKKLLYLALLFSYSILGNAELARMKLPLPEGVDGNEVNGEGVAFMYKVRRDIKKIQYGEPTKDGVLEGYYLFEGKKHSIHTLCELEDKHAGDVTLKSCLEKGKNDFAEKILPWAEEGRRVKRTTLFFMNEFCEMTKRKESYLLLWGKSAEGDEVNAFMKEVNNFKRFNSFLTDLADFFEVLIRSCPIATEQFISKTKRLTQQRVALQMVEEEALTDSYLKVPYNKEHVKNVFLHRIEKDTDITSQPLSQINKEPYKKLLTTIVREDKAKTAAIEKIAAALFDHEKVKDAPQKELLVVAIKKELDLSNQKIEKETIKKLLLHLLKEENVRAKHATH